MPAAISDNTRIEITFKNGAKGGTEYVIVSGPHEYSKELSQAPSKGWSFVGATLLD